MSTKNEILGLANAFDLNPHIIDKDYVLGWLLWGIRNHESIGDCWIFKGGTCLRKCFFETYRFSEDLDFTLVDSSQMNEDFLKTVFAEIGERVFDHTGIELPSDFQNFNVYEAPGRHRRCQARIGYQGPISPPRRKMPRIKVDLTADEVVALPPITVEVFHSYSDAPNSSIQAYAYEEIYAEKIRALVERKSPRDLYDVITLFRNAPLRPNTPILHDALAKKCAFKGIPFPAFDQLESSLPDLGKSWPPMLGRQLPATSLDIETLWCELPAFFRWLETEVEPETPPACVGSPEEESLHVCSQLLSLPVKAQYCLDLVRFAAIHRFCAEIDYQKETRLIEPYSLRKTKSGDIVLYAYDLADDELRGHLVERLRKARVINQTFAPRFKVELLPTIWSPSPGQ